MRASIPLLGLGRLVRERAAQVLPASSDQDWTIARWRLRQRICIFPDGQARIVGWMAANGSAPAAGMVGERLTNTGGATMSASETFYTAASQTVNKGVYLVSGKFTVSRTATPAS